MDVSFDLFIVLFNFIFFGSFLFITLSIIKTANASRKVQNNINSVNRETEKNSHASQVAYSQYYSEKPIKDSGVHDGPLSEAEKNVLYG